jgi:SPP1 family predicted phage head-tail adaptor
MANFDVQVSDLRYRITFQSPTINKAASGAQTESYANIATNPTVWAQIVWDHGQNVVVATDAERSEQRGTVTIRYRSDVSDKWQVLVDGNAYKIISPPDHVRGLNRWTVFRIERIEGTV